MSFLVNLKKKQLAIKHTFATKKNEGEIRSNGRIEDCSLCVG